MSTIQKLIQGRRLSTILLGLLSAAKIITDAAGWNVITNQEINDLTNGAAALMTVLSVVMSHNKGPHTSGPSVGEAGPVSAPGPQASPKPSDSGTTDAGGAGTARIVVGGRICDPNGPTRLVGKR
ncbi:hypothetical protein NZD89_09455 [Alicyclobacillus fastidiosus]|uniref:Phage holin n=1 Tax=Alicyclobacillus fastidiosus TaxID=392011 RepID=A0ABY6ZM66_9BACL|nr:hypothetical protein [Alicyclobacillus fastidiosus]WAH43582.1 hypothetical protein NZD89_09455 [Alicyclobacillus fastidiosus]GMA59763.1 hypothetical protein GCM10025859_02030 [Alicyclobacillus fastidiosus]